MITSSEEYYSSLFKINNPDLAILLPSTNENIYNIDLDSRTIEAPAYISVVQDHKAETIYFIVDRFYDMVDLSSMACIIQYVNAASEVGYYVVPFFDIETYAATNKILIPWCIEGTATKAAGTIQFTVRFFKADGDQTSLVYNISTQTASSKVLYGMDMLAYYPIEVTEDTYETGKYYIKQNDDYVLSNDEWSSEQTYYIYASGDYNFTSDMYNSIELKLDNILSKIADAEAELPSVNWIEL